MNDVAAAGCSGHVVAMLEEESQRELHLPRSVRLSDLAEGSGAELSCRAEGI